VKTAKNLSKWCFVQHNERNMVEGAISSCKVYRNMPERISRQMGSHGISNTIVMSILSEKTVRINWYNNHWFAIAVLMYMYNTMPQHFYDTQSPWVEWWSLLLHNNWKGEKILKRSKQSLGEVQFVDRASANTSRSKRRIKVECYSTKSSLTDIPYQKGELRWNATLRF
jgi:hypothetical protein